MGIMDIFDAITKARQTGRVLAERDKREKQLDARIGSLWTAATTLGGDVGKATQELIAEELSREDALYVMDNLFYLIDKSGRSIYAGSTYDKLLPALMHAATVDESLLGSVITKGENVHFYELASSKFSGFSAAYYAEEAVNAGVDCNTVIKTALGHINAHMLLETIHHDPYPAPYAYYEGNDDNRNLVQKLSEIAGDDKALLQLIGNTVLDHLSLHVADGGRRVLSNASARHASYRVAPHVLEGLYALSQEVNISSRFARVLDHHPVIQPEGVLSSLRQTQAVAAKSRPVYAIRGVDGEVFIACEHRPVTAERYFKEVEDRCGYNHQGGPNPLLNTQALDRAWQIVKNMWGKAHTPPHGMAFKVGEAKGSEKLAAHMT